MIVDKKNPPLFTVIVPVYNVERYIEDCVASILVQDFEDFELLLVDDGSRDSSGLIIERLALQDNRVRVFHKENGGSISARKYGCLHAIGRYVIVIDSDDYIDQGHFSAIAKELSNHFYPDMLLTGFKRVGEQGELVGEPTYNLLEPNIYNSGDVDYLKDNFLYSTEIKGANTGLILFSLCCKIVERTLFVSEIVKVPESIVYGEDMYLTALFLLKASRILVTDIKGYNYRMNGFSIMHSFSLETLDGYETTIKAIEPFFSADENKINVFSEHVLTSWLGEMARKADSYKTFKKTFLESLKNETIWCRAKKAKYKMRFVDRIKRFLLLKRLPLFFYLRFK